jgi:hypothetical protein
MNIKRVAVYDMDGTIVCSLHRYRTIMGAGNIERIDLQYWRDNEYRAGDDSLLPLAEQYKRDLQDENCYVIIATARVINTPDRVFIRDILGKPDALISRAANDTRSGGLLKVLGLQKYYYAFAEAEWVFYEDNATYLKTVCDHYNIRGVYVPSKQGH